MNLFTGEYAVEINSLLTEGFIEYWLKGKCLGCRKIGTPSPEDFDTIRLTPSDASWLGLK